VPPSAARTTLTKPLACKYSDIQMQLVNKASVQDDWHTRVFD